MEKITIQYRDQELGVDGIYTPGEEADYFDGYSGSAAEFEVHGIFLGKNDVTSLFCEEMMEEIKNLVIDKIEL
jgi:hypothetical protein